MDVMLVCDPGIERHETYSDDRIASLSRPCRGYIRIGRGSARPAARIQTGGWLAVRVADAGSGGSHVLDWDGED
jgi:hypothetical protein